MLAMLLQDVRDNKTEAANAAPQALRLCQMVGFTAPHVNIPMHYDLETTSISHVHCIAVALATPMTVYIYMYIVFERAGLSNTHFAQIAISISTVKMVLTSQPVAEQHVRSPAKVWSGVPCGVPIRAKQMSTAPVTTLPF